MNSYAIPIQGKNLKQIGNKIILSLAENGNISKYRVVGNIIFLECTDQISKGIIEGKNVFDSVLSSSNQYEIYYSIRKLIKEKKAVSTFAVRVTRKGEHPYDSTSLARDVAGSVFEEWKRITVSLDKPELEIIVQIINNVGIIYMKYT